MELFKKQLIKVDNYDLKQLAKALDYIKEQNKIILKRLQSLENNINRIDHDLKILEDFHLDHNKIHGELQTQTEEMGIIREKLDKNLKTVETVSEEIIDEIQNAAPDPLKS